MEQAFALPKPRRATARAATAFHSSHGAAGPRTPARDTLGPRAGAPWVRADSRAPLPPGARFLGMGTSTFPVQLHSDKHTPLCAARRSRRAVVHWIKPRPAPSTLSHWCRDRLPLLAAALDSSALRCSGVFRHTPVPCVRTSHIVKCPAELRPVGGGQAGSTCCPQIVRRALPSAAALPADSPSSKTLFRPSEQRSRPRRKLFRAVRALHVESRDAIAPIVSHEVLDRAGRAIPAQQALDRATFASARAAHGRREDLRDLRLATPVR